MLKMLLHKGKSCGNTSLLPTEDPRSKEAML